MQDISSIKHWAIHPDYLPKIKDKELSTHKITIPKRSAKHLISDYYANYSTSESYKTLSVAYIPIMGHLSKYSWLSYGMKELTEMVKAADANPNVGAILLEIDSPGGTVDGTEELATTLHNVSKPLVAFVDGLAASAAYYLASQADQIVANKLNYNEIGSIGVIQITLNYSTLDATRYGKVNILRSTNSPEKARPNYMEPLTEEQEKKEIEILDVMYDNFIAAIDRGRPNKIKDRESTFNGQIFNNEEALSRGLIDSIGTFEECVSDIYKKIKSENEGPKASIETVKPKMEYTDNLDLDIEILKLKNKILS